MNNKNNRVSKIMKVNKKLWSFIFGCLIAASFVWLISFGKNAAVLEFFHQYPDFVIDYYALTVTAVATVGVTFIIIFIMNWIFNVCTSEHPFWLILPSVTFIFLTLFTSKLMLASMLSAAIPALTVLVFTAVIFRFLNVNRANNKKAT